MWSLTQNAEPLLKAKQTNKAMANLTHAEELSHHNACLITLLSATMIQFNLDRPSSESYVYQIFGVHVLGPTIVEAASNAARSYVFENK